MTVTALDLVLFPLWIGLWFFALRAAFSDGSSELVRVLAGAWFGFWLYPTVARWLV
jgi:uncharacterized membrane protein